MVMVDVPIVCAKSRRLVGGLRRSKVRSTCKLRSRVARRPAIARGQIGKIYAPQFMQRKRLRRSWKREDRSPIGAPRKQVRT